MVSKPHGGKLVSRVLDKSERILEEAKELPSLEISKDTAIDLENIAHGVFSPLEGFLVRNDYLSVLDQMRLESDIPWTIPIVLDANKSELKEKELKEGDTILLSCASKNIALMEIEEIYDFDKKQYAEKVFKTLAKDHPGVSRVFEMKDSLLGGKIDFIRGVENPFENYTLYPIETRILFKEKGWKSVVGFQTRNAPHLAHEYVQKTALTFVDGLFINPVIGKKKKGDFKDEVILKSYEELIRNFYLKDRAVLAILRTEMRYAGPREAVFHAIIRKNFGCTHFIVGRDHAGVGNYYKPYEAQEIFEEFPDLGITPIFFKRFYYCKRCSGYVNERVCPHRGKDIIPPSGTKIREFLMKKQFPPKEMMRPEIARIILNFENPFVE